MNTQSSVKYTSVVWASVVIFAGCNGGGSQFAPSGSPTRAASLSAQPSKSVERVIYSFDGFDGYRPVAGMFFDRSGALFGASFEGGTYDLGDVFKLSRHGKAYTEHIVWSFGNGQDGRNPIADLMEDASGALYSTTDGGGAYAYGTVFKLTPSGASYTESVLWSFNGHDGGFPYAGLVSDNNGALYGTTCCAGAYAGGSVFKLSPSASRYTETVLWSFGNGQDGKNSYAGLLRKDGALYGTAARGGSNICSFYSKEGCGIVFKLTPHGKTYKEQVLWNFGGTPDGSFPEAGLIADAAGSLYGTTDSGGRYGGGSVFKLTRNSKKYTESVLWSFGNTSDGANPQGGLLAGASGALYGTTYDGGAYGNGAVFELLPSGSGYTEHLIWSFLDGQDGTLPEDGLVADKHGELYGTTNEGGNRSACAGGCGTVFKVLP
ncbi:MAG TPA: choice-of-anchor tandem repeat GloVer-containing protein [Candidatus Cybelea sp.]